jgi:hypothetical protein
VFIYSINDFNQEKGAGQYKAAATNWCQIVTKCREYYLTTWLAEICEADPRVYLKNKTENHFSP